MNNIDDIKQSDLTMANLIDLRYDEERGVIKIYQIRGRLVLEENFRLSFIG